MTSELYANLEPLLAAGQLATAMLGMGALLSPSDFIAVFRTPRALALGLGIQWLLVPWIALALAYLLGVGPGAATGLILIAAVPGGTMSNLMTHFARGNIALSISLTAVTTLASLATTPLLLELYAGAHLPDGFEMPTAKIASDIALVLLGPLFLGMAAGDLLERRSGREARERFSRWSIRASLAVIALLVIGAGSSGRLDPTVHPAHELAAIPLLGIAIFALVWGLVRVLRLPSVDRSAITIEATLRNSNLGVLVKTSLFPATLAADPVGDGVLLIVLLYGGLQIPLALIPVAFRARGQEF